MQEITDPPAMNSPYSLTSGSYGAPDAPNAPKLGTPVPGTVGGLPQKPGLSVASNPLAPSLRSGMAEGVAQSQSQPEDFMQYPMQQQRPSAYPQVLPVSSENQDQQMNQGYAKGGLASLARPAAEATRQMGRGQDTMLVHMTPNEVNSLQGLAMSMGGSLTINPKTGLPEAGWLGKLLPTILGVAGAAFGIPTWAIGLGVGAGQTALTGSLGKGLMAGLGAAGGASLGQAAGIGGKLGNVGQSLGLTQSATGASGALSNLTAKAAADQAAVKAGTLAADKAASAGFLSKFGAEAGLGAKGMLGKALPIFTGSAMLGGVSEAFQPKMPTYAPQEDSGYAGPYRYAPQTVRYPSQSPIESGDSSEFLYFTPSQPQLMDVAGNPVGGFGPAPASPMGLYDTVGSRGLFAKGGEVALADGAFVVDARTVSEMGNGSSSAGQELLARMGGRPVRGPGDGVSDSIPARIGRNQPARVARDEVIFNPEAVRKIGNGDQKRGAQKLYSMMEKAHKARKKAGRGEDTKLRKGLA